MAHQVLLAVVVWRRRYAATPPGYSLSLLSTSLAGGRRWRLSQAPDN
ncbi:MAG: hypothetical protein R6W76_06725 [Caldilinea sp.]